MERCRLDSDHVRSLAVIGGATKTFGGGRKLAVLLEARGEQEVPGASYCSGPGDGGNGDGKKTD